MFNKKTNFNYEMNQKKSSTLIKNFVKKFRNYLRISRTFITKKIIHEAFATLQKKSSKNKKTNQEKKSKKFFNRELENRSCLCDKKTFI